jgi:uncharacterized protein (TIGR03083 family)
VDKQQLLKRIDAAWAELTESYAGLSDVQMEAAGAVGEWSVRDILAHVTAWEEEALKYLPLILEGGRPPRYKDLYGGIDAFNARTTEAQRSLSLAEVMQQFEETHRRLIEYIAGAPDDELTRETRFRRRIRLDTYGHYPHHAVAIREWRERQGS